MKPRHVQPLASRPPGRALWLLPLLVVACAPRAETVEAPGAAEEVFELASLEEVIARDAAVFDLDAPAAALVDAMAAHRVVVWGAFLGVAEQQDVLTALIAPLYGRGLRTLLLEEAQAYIWWVERYVTGRVDRLPTELEAEYGALLTAVRTLNAAHPEAPIQVGMIGVDDRAYMFPSVVMAMAAEGVRAGPTDAFLERLGIDDGLDAPFPTVEGRAAEATWGHGYASALEEVLIRFEQAPPTDPDGALLYAMAEVAAESLRIEDVRIADGEVAAASADEGLVQRLVTPWLASAEGTTLIWLEGMGSRRAVARGDDAVWLTERLRAADTVAADDLMTLQFLLADWTWVSDDFETPLSFRVPSGELDLVATLASFAGDRYAFLPLGDPRFGAIPHLVTYAGFERTHRPAAYFDGYVLIPDAHSF